MKIDMYIILCVHEVWLQIHPYLKVYLRDAWTSAFSLLVLQMFPMYLQGLQVDKCIFLASVAGAPHVLTRFASAV